MHPGSATPFSCCGWQLWYLLPEIFPLITEIIYVAENLCDIEARYNGRLSPDLDFSYIFLVSAFFCEFFTDSQLILAIASA
jgi:hypothetical protein